MKEKEEGTITVIVDEITKLDELSIGLMNCLRRILTLLEIDGMLILTRDGCSFYHNIYFEKLAIKS